MDIKIAKELLHIRDWLDRAQVLVDAGKAAYDADDLLREAGDSLMMKIGEAANRLSRAGVAAPEGVEWADAITNRNWLIHQYDNVNREVTWSTLTDDLAGWRIALADTFTEVAAYLANESAQASKSGHE